MISAISDTKVKVDFNKEVPHSKLTKSSFTILNKKSQPVTILLAKAETKEKKTSVTLTLAASLAANLEPYTLLINKTVLDITPNSYDIVIPKEEISIKDVFISAGNGIKVTASVELAAAPVAADLILMDITDPDNPKEEIIGASALVADDATKFTATTTNNPYFKAGKKYQLTVKSGKLKDKIGNVNKAPVSYEFTMPEEGEAPKLTKVTLKRQKDDKTKVFAVLEFDRDVVTADGASAKIAITDKDNYATQIKDATAKFAGDMGIEGQTGIKPVPANQVVLLDIMTGAPAGFSLVEGKTYLFRLMENEVKTLSLPATNNKQSDADVTGVDVTAPTIVGGTLVSSKEIEIQFSERVTYDHAEVKFDGFDAGGDSVVGGVVAKVSLSADGMKATLTPKNPKENFQTIKTGKLIFANGTFLDEQENEMTGYAGAGSTIDKVVDKAVPVAVKAAYDNVNKKITITFTEDVQVTDSVTAETKMTLTKDADTFQLEYNAGGEDNKKWAIVGGKVVAKETAKLTVAGYTAFLEAGVLQDAEDNVAVEVEIKSN